MEIFSLALARDAGKSLQRLEQRVFFFFFFGGFLGVVGGGGGGVWGWGGGGGFFFFFFLEASLETGYVLMLESSSAAVLRRHWQQWSCLLAGHDDSFLRCHRRHFVLAGGKRGVSSIYNLGTSAQGQRGGISYLPN